MKKEEILRKVLRKAVKNGMDESLIIFPDNNGAEHIFNHDFAKAFWGEELVNKYGKNKDEFCSIYQHYRRGEREWNKLSVNHFNISYNLLERWQYHLQQLAISEDRLAYIERFLD